MESLQLKFLNTKVAGFLVGIEVKTGLEINLISCGKTYSVLKEHRRMT